MEVNGTKSAMCDRPFTLHLLCTITKASDQISSAIFKTCYNCCGILDEVVWSKKIIIENVIKWLVKLDVFLGAVDCSIITKWKKHATIHTEIATTEQEGQLSEKWSSSQNSLDEMEETVDVWTISQRVTRLPFMCECYKKATIEEGQHEVTQFTRRHDSTF